MGEIAVRNGYPVVFLHALKREGEKDPDAFMGRLLTDFKRIKISQIEHRLGDAFEQAPNAFIEIEDNVTRREFLRKVKLFLDNVRNTDIEKAAKPKRAAAIKKNVVGAILFYFVDGKFGNVKLDEMK